MNVSNNSLRSMTSGCCWSHHIRPGIVHATLSLNVTQVRVNVVLEQGTSGVVVELEQNRAGHRSNLTLDNEEETANVDTVKAEVTQGGLVTEQDGTFWGK